MLDQMQWLGHDTFKIESGGKVIYTDPFQLKDGLPKADLILITHEHYDHCSPDDVKKITKDGTVIVAPGDCEGKLTGNVRMVKPGDRLTEMGVDIEAVPAYNTNKQFHPRFQSWVGYIFTLEGEKDISGGRYRPHPGDEGLPVRHRAPAGIRDIRHDGGGGREGRGGHKSGGRGADALCVDCRHRGRCGEVQKTVQGEDARLQEGRMNLYYASIDLPTGPAFAAATKDGLCKLDLNPPSFGEFMEEVEANVSRGACRGRAAVPDALAGVEIIFCG